MLKIDTNAILEVTSTQCELEKNALVQDEV